MANHKIPISRLNQIARRKLMALGIPTRSSGNGDHLEGEISILPPYELNNPLNGQIIKKIGFVVKGHDHLKITSPPALSGLPPQQFFVFDRVIPLISQIIEAFQLRLAGLKTLGDQLRRLGVPFDQDRDRAMIVVKLELEGSGVVAIDGDERGLSAVDLRTLDGRLVSLGGGSIDLEGMSDRSDLSLYLSQMIEQLGKEGNGPTGMTPSVPSESVSASAYEEVLGYQQPVAGEVWMMTVLIEQEAGEEIRYVGVNVDGQPYGAPRVLPRDVFMNMFVETGCGIFSLLVEVLDVKSGKVAYDRLDSERQPTSQPTASSAAAFLANFCPEAASY